MSFERLGLAQPILRAVSTEGYTTPTPIQAQAIPYLIAGRDLLGCAQTGTGKTAAFALPVLHRLMHSTPGSQAGKRRIRALILSPTRELASQIADSLHAYGRHTGLRHTVVYGGVSQVPQTRDLKRGVDILVATPGRLADLMNQGYIDLSSVEIFVLDEADRMLDMGFLPDIRRVIEKLPGKRQNLFFSATMPAVIAQLADGILSEPVRVQIAPVKATTELIEQSVCFVAQQEKTKRLANFLNALEVTRALVFTRTKYRADRVVQILQRHGLSAEAFHSNKTQAARQRILCSFKSSRTQILVATDIAARGIDVDGISHVFNYDLPAEAETYVHRIGRTGRAGAAGVAIAFCSNEERRLLKTIERLTGRPLTVRQDHSHAERETDLPPVDRDQTSPSGKPAGSQDRSDNQPQQRRRRFAGSRKSHQFAGRPFGQGARHRTKKRRQPADAAR